MEVAVRGGRSAAARREANDEQEAEASAGSHRGAQCATVRRACGTACHETFRNDSSRHPGSRSDGSWSAPARPYAAFFFPESAASTYLMPFGVICGPFAVRRA